MPALALVRPTEADPRRGPAGIPPELHQVSVCIAQALVNAMEAKDVFLRGHSQRVAELAAAIAGELGLDAEAVGLVRIAGRLHDVGKIGIRETVLLKPGPLATDEYEHIKTHVQIGVDILAPLGHLGEALDYVAQHHEHLDGTGYPRGLRGHEISLGGRILAVADMFDALTSRRPYREPLTPCQAIELLAGLAGRAIDRDVFETLCRLVLPASATTLAEAVA
jgi:putative two-component system response regulator